jgi:hypothetical protein
LIKAKEE